VFRSVRRTVTSLLVCLAASQIVAQNPVPQFRSGVDVLQLDVSVLDKSRRPVRGLTQTDFTVEIGGKPAAIVAFTPVTLPSAAPAAPAAWMTDVAPDIVSNQLPEEGRLIVLLFDQSLGFAEMDDARRIARSTVTSMAPGDLAAVSYVGQAVPQNFTADRSKLLAAIDQPFLGHVTVEGGPPSGECQCGTCKLEVIEHIADSLRPAERRRKVLIFVGSDIRFQAPPSAGCSFMLKEARTRLFRALDRANMAVHSFDPMGLRTMVPDASKRSPALPPVGAESERQLNLGVLPARTGGRVVLNTNAPEEKVTDVLAESESYYVLGVERPAPRASGRDQEVEIKVNRKGVTVSSSRAYNPAPSVARPAGKSSPDDPPRALVDALAGVWPATAIDLTMTTAVFDVPGKKTSAVAIVTTITEPSASRDPAAPPRLGRTLNVLAGAWDRNGRPTATETRTVEVVPVPDQAAGLARMFQIASRLDLPRGKHDVRVAVVDPATGRKGSLYTTVDIPNFEDELSLSGVVVGTSPAPPLALADAFGGLLPIIPTALREFTSRSRVTVFSRAYQGGSNPPRDVRMTARLVGISNAPIVEETSTLVGPRFTASRGADYLFELPVATLAPGSYLLTLTAALGEKKVKRHMRFQMRNAD
jgi:VWFA-related protein